MTTKPIENAGPERWDGYNEQSWYQRFLHLDAAIAGIADDYMTSGVHHPGHVLIPTAKFEQLCTFSSQPQSSPDQWVNALKAARDIITNNKTESGYCVCGGAVSRHTGHTPVDRHTYHATRIIEQIDAALPSTELHAPPEVSASVSADMSPLVRRVKEVHGDHVAEVTEKLSDRAEWSLRTAAESQMLGIDFYSISMTLNDVRIVRSALSGHPPATPPADAHQAGWLEDVERAKFLEGFEAGRRHPLAAPAGVDEVARAFPKTIGRRHLGEDRSDGERLCDDGHDVPAGHPLYWYEPMSQYDDSDPCCLEHAIEQYASELGWSAAIAALPSTDAIAIRAAFNHGYAAAWLASPDPDSEYDTDEQAAWDQSQHDEEAIRALSEQVAGEVGK